jgi:biotin carboxylase
LKVLLLASGISFQYRVLRCAAAGAEVFILGDTVARGLAMSRYCRRFLPSACEISFENASQIAQQINACVEELGIACVLPSDAGTTRILTSIRSELRSATFPMPDLATFDTLNDKGRFAGVCAELGLPHPESRIASTVEDLRQLFHRGEIRLPSIAKPPTMYGGIGVVTLEQGNARESIDKIDYEPILIQDFIEGDDISIALFCDQGRTVAEVVYLPQSAALQFVHNDMLCESARKVASHFAYDGVIGFDARLSPDGRSVALIECNPRFWFNMDFAMAAGINFVKLGLGEATGPPAPSADGTTVRTRKLLLLNMFMPWRLTRQDLNMLAYCSADPVGLVLSSFWPADVGISERAQIPIHRRPIWLQLILGIPRKLAGFISKH